LEPGGLDFNPSPVRGLRPVRAARLPTANVPNQPRHLIAFLSVNLTALMYGGLEGRVSLRPWKCRHSWRCSIPILSCSQGL
jgi:hypothetical protein